MITIIILFTLAALVGLSLLLKVMKGEKPDTRMAILHGALAAVALVLLVIEVYGGNSGLTTILALFVVAALGGFFLFFKDLSGKSIPKPVAFIHAGAAAVAFVMLLLAYFN